MNEVTITKAVAQNKAKSRRFNLPHIFGYDFFISFKLGPPPIGAQSYASDLARRLRELDFTVFFSEEEAPPGAQLDTTLIKALHLSRILVVIANEGALVQSQWVRKEVEEYRLKHPRRPVIPINVGGAIAKHGPAAETSRWLDPDGSIWLDETNQAVEEGISSQEVVKRLEVTPRFMKANTWLRLVTGVIFLSLATLTAFAFWQWSEAIREAERANAARLAVQGSQFLTKDDSLLVRAMLLAAESMKLIPSDAAADTLRTGLSRLARSTAVIDFTNNRTKQGDSADGRFHVQLNTAFSDQFSVFSQSGAWQAKVLSDGKEIALIKPSGGVDQNVVCTNQPDWLKVEVKWGGRIARVTNIRTGEFAILVHDGAITGCGMNPDASTLITVSGDIRRELPPVPIPGDYSLRIWRMPPGIFRLSQDQGADTNLIATDFSSDGRFAAGAFDNENYVRLFDIKSGYELARLATNDANTTALFSVPTAAYLARLQCTATTFTCGLPTDSKSL